MKAATRLLHYEACPGDSHRPTSTPIYQSATFEQEDALHSGAYDYCRSGNPTRSVLEEQLADLEGAARALALSSGMAALSAVTRLVPHGGRILAGDDLYGGTWRLLSQVTAALGVRIQYVDTTDLKAVSAELAQGADLLLLETPTNPRLQISDLGALATLCRAHSCLLAVDNSMMSPLRQQPLALGADLVVHSATKFLGGHADLSAGVIAVADPAVGERLAFFQNAEGNALAPFDSWLLLRGLKTLAVRLRAQEMNAAAVVDLLSSHSAVHALAWPGLLQGEAARIHAAQASGPGTLICFQTGDLQRSAQVVQALRCFPTTVSFGSVSSTASLPCRMSHASLPEEVRRARRLPEDLIRLSIGIEDAQDLVEDLRTALDALEICRHVRVG